MANTITSSYGLATSWQNQAIYGTPTQYENYDLASVVHEMNSLKKYIDHLEKIMTDFEGRIEALESPEEEVENG